jgi:hypothetical protein
VQKQHAEWWECELDTVRESVVTVTSSRHGSAVAHSRAAVLLRIRIEYFTPHAIARQTDSDAVVRVPGEVYDDGNGVSRMVVTHERHDLSLIIPTINPRKTT